jgi:hypothetical protein
MERSARFLSLSGWSGIWAGLSALLGGGIALVFLEDYYVDYNTRGGFDGSAYETLRNRLFFLGLAIFLLAVSGAYGFTYKKVKKQGLGLWNSAAKRFLFNLLLPVLAGGVFVAGFLFYNDWQYVAPACLIFYGLGLINAGKFTINDVRYLGILEVILGCICIFFPGAGLYFWLLGFGILHIVYGIVMWNKYDKERLS